MVSDSDSDDDEEERENRKSFITEESLFESNFLVKLFFQEAYDCFFSGSKNNQKQVSVRLSKPWLFNTLKFFFSGLQPPSPPPQQQQQQQQQQQRGKKIKRKIQKIRVIQ